MANTGRSIFRLNCKRRFREKGMVNIAAKLLEMHMNRLRGILPLAMPVKTVPDATVTGATAIIQAPTMKSVEFFIKRFARKNVIRGNNTNEEISDADKVLIFLISSTIVLESR